MFFKRFTVLLTSLLLLSAACSGSGEDVSQNPSLCKSPISEIIVTINGTAFEPATLEIKKCTKVVFKNQDTKAHWPASDFHPTHGIYPEFDPMKVVESGQEWSFIFEKAGAWKYHDHLFPQIRGIINVQN